MATHDQHDPHHHTHHVTDHITDHIPEKKQSIFPDRSIWIGLIGVAVILAVIVLAVGWATSGHSDCPTAKPGAAHSKCT